jgi:hypothetical protein
MVLPLAVVLLLTGCAKQDGRPDSIDKLPPPSIEPTTTTTVEAGARPEATVPPNRTPSGGCQSGIALETGRVDAAAGFRGLGITLINCGTTPVTVEGFPSVEVLGDKGQTLELRAEQGVPVDGWRGPATTFAVAPLHSATFIVTWHNTVDRTDIPPAVGWKLAVKPTGALPVQVIPIGFGDRMDLGTTGKFNISPWKPDK